MKRITVFGATGMLGTPVTKQLIKAGFQVTALVRDVQKAKRLFPIGVTFIKGDLQDPAAIRQALEHADGLYISLHSQYKEKAHGFATEREGLDNILIEAKASQVRQVIFLSSFLARNYQGGWWVFQAKKSGIQKIKNSGIPYTIFYPSNFFENFHNGMIRGNSVTILAHPEDHPYYWISGADFGNQVVQAFIQPHAISKEYPAQGPEALTYTQAAEQFANHYPTKNLKVSKSPFSVLKFISLFSPQIKFLAQLADVSARNIETFESESTWKDLGKPETTIAMFATQP